jgi:hypothetical protein
VRCQQIALEIYAEIFWEVRIDSLNNYIHARPPSKRRVAEKDHGYKKREERDQNIRRYCKSVNVNLCP